MSILIEFLLRLSTCCTQVAQIAFFNFSVDDNLLVLPYTVFFAAWCVQPANTTALPAAIATWMRGGCT